MVDFLRTALSGLNASQRALATTGHNIANVNNPDFSRQRVDLVTDQPQKDGRGYIGTGVVVGGIDRVYDGFLATQVRTHTSTVERLTALDELTGQLDSLVADPDASLAPTLEEFFAAAEDLANDPASVPARQVLLSSADSLAGRFQDLNKRMELLREDVNTTIRTTVSDINGLAEAIVGANKDIALAQGSTGKAPADLLDHRDGLLKELSAKVTVQVVPGDNGAVNVFIGNGQALVVGETSQPLVVDRSAFDPQDITIRYQGQSRAADISPDLVGGKIGGLLTFRQEVLDPAQSSLGMLATGLGATFNAVHTQGVDLAGQPGQAMFDLAEPRTLPNGENPSLLRQQNGGAPAPVVDTVITDVSQLLGSDYDLSYTASGDYRLERLLDGQVTTLSGNGPHLVDGLEINIDTTNGTPLAGDRFLIQPTRNGAGELEVLLSDPRQLAAALPGSGVGDNRNALALAQLQTDKPMLDGKAGFQELYGQLVGKVGSQGRRYDNSLAANQVLLQQAEASRESVSGVNLDEEAANLMRFQQAYQASAQMIKVADSLFQTVLDTVRR